MKKAIWISLILSFSGGPALAQSKVFASDITKAVEVFVQQELEGSLEGEMRIEVNTRWQGIVELESAGEPQIRVRRGSSRPLRGPTVLRVGIDVDGQTLQTMSVTADIRYLRPVLVARYMLGRGEALEESMVEMAERDITTLRNGYFTELALLQDMQTRRSLAEGAVLTRNHVAAIPVVKRGAAVELVARTNRFSATALGEAMQDGGVGERIRVKNSDSGKILYGQILDAYTIQMGL
jgi:flagella basal body P-ring formation protein FlgA